MKKLNTLSLVLFLGINSIHAQWTTVYQNLSSSSRFEAIAASSKDTVLFSGAFGTTGINYTAGEGGWYTVPSSYHFSDIHFFNGRIGYGTAAVDVGMQKTLDGGKTWSLISRPETRAMGCVWAVSATKVFFGGAGAVWRTDNGGLSTYAVNNVRPSVVSSRVTDIFFPTSTIGYLVTEDGIVRKTTDGGTNWDSVAAVPSIGRRLYFTDENTGYYAGSGGVFKTTDGGDTWKKYAIKSAFFHGIHFYDKQHGIVAGIGGQVYFTQDAGATWTESSTGSTVDLYDAFLLAPTKALVCGDKFTLLKNNDLLVTSLEEAVRSTGLRLYPNPMKDCLQVSFLNEGTWKGGELQICGMDGNVVLSKQMLQGEEKIDVSSLPAGIYFAKLIDNGQIRRVEKLMK